MNILQLERLLSAFWSEQDGVTAIEYALLAALIFGVIIAAVALVGTNLAEFFDSLAKKFP